MKVLNSLNLIAVTKLRSILEVITLKHYAHCKFLKILLEHNRELKQQQRQRQRKRCPKWDCVFECRSITDRYIGRLSTNYRRSVGEVGKVSVN